MEFAVLGPLEVRDGARVVRVPGPRQRALLSILLLRANEVVPSARLIELLWGENPPGSAGKGLQVHVSQLRKSLRPDVVVTRTPGYLIRVEPGELDLERFERLVAEARQLPPESALERLREALALWRGSPLAEFADEPFARIEVLRLEELRLEAIESRIEAELALGRHTALVGELEALVAGHPHRERLRRQLMLALYRSGRQVESLAAYQDARRTLVEDLGLEPGRALQELEQAILRQDPSLEPGPAEPPPAPAPVRVEDDARSRTERKLATALFADLVASTELGEQDPERTRALLERFYDAAAAEIESAGGTVEKFAGDAVMAAFGAPAAHEDHAERALHAALAVRSRCEELFGGAVQLRIGVETGEVVVGRARQGSSFVTGDAVNVAARLEQAAEPGEILVGQRTALAVGSAFELDEPRTVPAKGKAGGVVCHRLARALTRARPRGISGLGRSFVGRGHELDVLHVIYRRAVERREPHLVTIVGDAGVGKTRLLGALAEQLERVSPQPVQHAGRCLPYGRGVTYWPLGDVLRSRLGILESDPEAAIRARLSDRAILAVTLGLEPPAEQHPLVARESLHAAWVEFLAELAGERPAVVVIEDLHWAEEPLLDLLDQLRREVEGPLLLVATARPELLDLRSSWGAGGRNTTQLWLDPLSEEYAELMLSQLLETDLPEGLRRLVLARAEGNPFFLEELLATLIDLGLLERTERGWRVSDPPREFAVPDSVQSVLAARIDLLDPMAKAALQAASVVGRTFWAGPVAELLEGAEIDWRTLEERDFVRRRARSTLAGEREFAFKHALTRDVAYSSVPKARRARLHAAFAAWIERVGEGRDEHAPLLAHHYAEAVRPEDVDFAWAGEEPEVERLNAKARSWLRRAAGLAGSRYAVDDEAGLLERAVELEPDDSERAVLLHSLAGAYSRAWNQAGFRRAMLEAIELATGPDLAELASELPFWDAFRWGHAEDREMIEGWIDRALDIAMPSSPARARALVARSYCVPEDSEAAAREACAIAEATRDVELRSYAYHALADSMLAQGRYDEAVELAGKRLELLERISDPDHVADVYWSAIPGVLGRGRFEEARQLAELHDEVTARLSPHHRLHGVAFRLEVEELAANWEGIEELRPRVERAVEASTPCVQRPRSLVVCALAAACLGAAAEAQRLEDAATALGAEEYGRVVDVRIRLALVRGDLERVERLLAESEAPEKKLIRTTKLSPVAARLDALAALGRAEAVEREAPERLRPGTYLEPFALRALGLVRGDGTLVEQAAERFAAMGLAWHAGQTQRVLV